MRYSNFIIFFFLLRTSYSQDSLLTWTKTPLCFNSNLYGELKLIDSTFYSIEEEVNREYNQSFYGDYFIKKFVQDHYSGKYLIKYPHKVIEELNCILETNPKNIKPRVIFLLSYFILEIDDDRYTEFLSLVIDNLELGNFDCSITEDCRDLFISLFYPQEYNSLCKLKYQEKNYNKESFKRLLDKIYNSKYISDVNKSSIKNEIEFLIKNKKY